MTEMCFSHLPLLLDEGVNASCGVVASYFDQKVCKSEISEKKILGRSWTLNLSIRQSRDREENFV